MRSALGAWPRVRGDRLPAGARGGADEIRMPRRIWPCTPPRARDRTNLAHIYFYSSVYIPRGRLQRRGNVLQAPAAGFGAAFREWICDRISLVGGLGLRDRLKYFEIIFEFRLQIKHSRGKIRT